VVVTTLLAARPGHFRRHNRTNRMLGSHTTRRHLSPAGTNRVPLRNRVPISRRRRTQSSSSPTVVIIMGTQGIRGGLSKAGSNSLRHSSVHTLCPHIRCGDAHALQPPLGYQTQPPSQAIQQPPRSGRNNMGTALLGAGDRMFYKVPGLRPHGLTPFLFWL